MSRHTTLPSLALAAVAIAAGVARGDADVIVYGATPGGVCAAIAAAREGAAVILLEPTDHVGGLTTGGLSHCDSNQMVRTTLLGLFDEWHRRVVKDYTDRGLPAPYDPTRKDQARWTFEPHVALRVTRRMLEESGVTVMTGQVLVAVGKDGPRITSLVTRKRTFTAATFVDGSYEGDLMAAAGVAWTIGREGRAEFGESYAAKQYPKQPMKFDGRGADGRLLPLVTTDDAGADEAGDAHVMTYSFRLCLTRDPTNLVPPPQPETYDPARFEVARRAIAAGDRVGFDLYPLPGAKFDGNNSIGGQISLGLVGGGTGWHAADEAGRRRIWEEHKRYTLEFLHFLRTDPAVPAKIRDEYAGLGFCRDEFPDTDHFPPALYVRESRRMRGMHVISQRDIIDTPDKEDAIAISSFPIDSHDCQRVARPDGRVINEGTIFPVRIEGTGRGYAYHVPYRAIVPPPEQCTNLLVPVALSCTHVAMCSLRIEGAWMVIGQSAGVAAALTAARGGTVQNLPYPALRERLLAQGQVLDLPGRAGTGKGTGTRSGDRETALQTPGSRRTDVAAPPAARGLPNIVVILFDDLGYGEPPCYRGDSPFTMPSLDRLAREGMRFTDAHSASAVCTPTRYGLLTGRYPCRIGQFGVLTTFSTPIIAAERLTVGGLLQRHGYHTACVGKWHLGMTWPDTLSRKGSDPAPVGATAADGPTARGFHTFHGYTHARNIGMIMEQDRVAAHVKDVETPPLLADKAVACIDERAKAGSPFFLYVPLCEPHTPVVPAALYRGRSGQQDYGDWLLQGDATVGRILEALDTNGIAGNTLVIVTSDNGPAGRTYAPLRGSKASIWEGGHRVPFVARWPGRIEPGRTCDDTICLTDLLATCADIVGAALPDDAGEDSVSILPLLLGTATGPVRETTVHQSLRGDLAIRQGPWKLVFPADGGDRELYNLHDDLGETTDLAATRPDDAERLAGLMRRLVDGGRSTPGAPQRNDAPVSLGGAPKKARAESRSRSAVAD